MKLLLILIVAFGLVSCSSDDEETSNNANNSNNTNNANNTNAVNNTSGNNTTGSNNTANNTTGQNNTSNNRDCVDTTVYDVDADGDGYAADDATSMTLCLTTAERVNHITLGNDCNDNDPLQFPRSKGICGDNVVDDCTGDGPEMQGNAFCERGDSQCPETQTGSLNVPEWDCEGTPPTNVYAWATFEDGNQYYQDGACFVFFEGFTDGFYVKHNLERVNQDASCETVNGCVCPTENNVPSYDRRLYAFTSDLAAEECPEIRLTDHACQEDLVQPVSNDCRKYLYQLHPYEMHGDQTPIERPYSYVAGSLDEIERRIEAFGTVEVACAQGSNFGLNWAQLMTGQIQLNDGFLKSQL